MNDSRCVCLQCFGKDDATLELSCRVQVHTKVCWCNLNTFFDHSFCFSLLSSFICASCQTSFPNCISKLFMFSLHISPSCVFLHALAYYECNCTLLPLRKYTPTCTTLTVTLLIHPVRQTLTLQGVE